ncbi:hypothetical protein [Streptomyces sp. NPDC000888]
MTAADWLKFAPGWFAAAVAVWTLTDKWRTRRHKVALGPDDPAVREALMTARSLFDGIIVRHGDSSPYDKGLAQQIVDLAARRDDAILRAALTDVVEAWNETAALSIDPGLEVDVSMVLRPGLRLPGLPSLEPVVPMGESRSARKRRLEVQKTAQETLAEQVAAAWSGKEQVEKALARLNKLERRTFGRS